MRLRDREICQNTVKVHNFVLIEYSSEAREKKTMRINVKALFSGKISDHMTTLF